MPPRKRTLISEARTMSLRMPDDEWAVLSAIARHYDESLNTSVRILVREAGAALGITTPAGAAFPDLDVPEGQLTTDDLTTDTEK